MWYKSNKKKEEKKNAHGLLIRLLTLAAMFSITAPAGITIIESPAITAEVWAKKKTSKKTSKKSSKKKATGASKGNVDTAGIGTATSKRNTKKAVMNAEATSTGATKNLKSNNTKKGKYYYYNKGKKVYTNDPYSYVTQAGKIQTAKTQEGGEKAARLQKLKYLQDNYTGFDDETFKKAFLSVNEKSINLFQSDINDAKKDLNKSNSAKKPTKPSQPAEYIKLTNAVNEANEKVDSLQKKVDAYKLKTDKDSMALRALAESELIKAKQSADKAKSHLQSYEQGSEYRTYENKYKQYKTDLETFNKNNANSTNALSESYDNYNRAFDKALAYVLQNVDSNFGTNGSGNSSGGSGASGGSGGSYSDGSGYGGGSSAGQISINGNAVSADIDQTAQNPNFTTWGEDDNKEAALTAFMNTSWDNVADLLTFETNLGENTTRAVEGCSDKVLSWKEKIKSTIKDLDNPTAPASEDYVEIMLCLMQVMSGGDPPADDPYNVKKYFWDESKQNEPIDAETSIKTVFEKLTTAIAIHNANRNDEEDKTEDWAAAGETSQEAESKENKALSEGAAAEGTSDNSSDTGTGISLETPNAKSSQENTLSVQDAASTENSADAAISSSAESNVWHATIYQNNDELQACIEAVVLGSNYADINRKYSKENAEDYINEHKEKYTGLAIWPDAGFAQAVCSHYKVTAKTILSVNSSSASNDNYYKLGQALSVLHADDDGSLTKVKKAVEKGFYAVEADVQLRGGTLYCYHTNYKSGTSPTLQDTYNAAKQHNTKVVMDLKSSSTSTLSAIASFITSNQAYDDVIIQTNSKSVMNTLNNKTEKTLTYWGLVMKDTSTLNSLISSASSYKELGMKAVNIPKAAGSWKLGSASNIKKLTNAGYEVCVFTWGSFSGSEINKYCSYGASYLMTNKAEN